MFETGRILWLALLLFVVGCASTSGASNSQQPTVGQPAATPSGSIVDLAAEFRKLRTIQGHFSGGAWNNQVDHPEGRKHQVMEQLREQFTSSGHTKAQVIDLFGPPDAVYQAGDRMFDMMAASETAAQRDAMLVYFWRGDHDFLYLDCKDETVLGAYWWLAGE